MNNIYYNNKFLDKKLIFTHPSEIEDFINNKQKEDNDLTFDIIDNIAQLIIPKYYSYLLDDVNYTEIFYFNSYLRKILLRPTEKEIDELKKTDEFKIIQIYGNELVQKLLNQIELKNLPKEIIIKYWLRIYTMESEFCYMLNESLRKKDKQVYFYYPFIKLCYEGVKKGYLKSYNKELYRYSQIAKDEFEIIIKKYEERNQDINIIPLIIVYSRSFLSFSMDEKNKRFQEKDRKNILCLI